MLFLRQLIFWFIYPCSISVFYDSRKQGLHDKLSKTIVVMKSNKPNVYYLSFPTHQEAKDNRLSYLTNIIAIVMVIVNLLYFYWINHDDRLLPGAQFWLAKEESTLMPAEDNLLYYLVGFGKTNDDNSFETGKKIVRNNLILSELKIQHTRKMVREMNSYGFPPTTPDSLRNLESILKGDAFLDKINGFDEKSIEFVKRNKGFFNQKLLWFSELKHQTEIIISKNIYYDDILQYDALSFQPYHDFHIYIRLRLISYLTDEGIQTSEILSFLEDLQRIYTLIIVNTRDLYTTRYTTFAYQNVIRFYGLLLDSDSVSKKQLNDSIFNLRTPTLDYENYETKIRHEFRNKIFELLSYMCGSDAIFKRERLYVTEKELNSLNWSKFKPNKTINVYYRNFSNILKGKINDDSDIVKLPFTFLSRLNNIVGIAGTNSSYYNVHDLRNTENTLLNLQSMSNLLKLKAMIYRDHVKEENIQEFLNTHADSLYDVLTREPMKWNSDEQEIYFGEKTETPEEYEAYLKMERDEKKNRRFRTSRHENPDALKLYFN